MKFRSLEEVSYCTESYLFQQLGMGYGEARSDVKGPIISGHRVSCCRLSCLRDVCGATSKLRKRIYEAKRFSETPHSLFQSAPFIFVQMEETPALTQRCTYKKDVGILGCLWNWRR